MLLGRIVRRTTHKTLGLHPIGLLLVVLLSACSPLVQGFLTQYNYYHNARTQFVSLWQSEQKKPSDEEHPPLDVAAWAAKQSFLQGKTNTAWESMAHHMAQIIALKNNQSENPMLPKLYLLQIDIWFYEGKLQEAEALTRHGITHFTDLEKDFEARLVRILCLQDRQNEISQSLIERLQNTSCEFAKIALVEYQTTSKAPEKAFHHLQWLANHASQPELRSRAYYLMGRSATHKEQQIYFQKALQYPIAVEDEVSILLSSIHTMEESEQLHRLEQLIQQGRYASARPRLVYLAGQLYEKQGKITQALHYYQMNEMAQSGSYTRRSWETAARLLELQNDFESAFRLYKQLQNQTATHETQYKHLAEHTAALQDLLTAQSIVKREDSLMAVAALPEAERWKRIDQTIKALRFQNLSTYAQPQTQGIPSRMDIAEDDSEKSEELFYFYNPTLVAAGKRLFELRWGNRILEDHWQRSNPNRLANRIDSSLTFSNNPSNEKALYSRAYHLARLPLTPEAFRASQERIRQALITITRLYRYKLNRPDLALGTEQSLHLRFP